MPEKINNNLREAKKEVLLQTFTLINGAFALVAALAWNEAIKAVIDRYFVAGSGLYSRFTYAIVITVIVVFVSRYIASITKRYEETNESAKDGPV